MHPSGAHPAHPSALRMDSCGSQTGILQPSPHTTVTTNGDSLPRRSSKAATTTATRTNSRSRHCQLTASICGGGGGGKQAKRKKRKERDTRHRQRSVSHSSMHSHNAGNNNSVGTGGTGYSSEFSADTELGIAIDNAEIRSLLLRHWTNLDRARLHTFHLWLFVYSLAQIFLFHYLCHRVWSPVYLVFCLCFPAVILVSFVVIRYGDEKASSRESLVRYSLLSAVTFPLFLWLVHLPLILQVGGV